MLGHQMSFLQEILFQLWHSASVAPRTSQTFEAMQACALLLVVSPPISAERAPWADLELLAHWARLTTRQTDPHC